MSCGRNTAAGIQVDPDVRAAAEKRRVREEILNEIEVTLFRGECVGEAGILTSERGVKVTIVRKLGE